MKPNPIVNKRSLIALLSLGLACAPLVVNADNVNHGWRGHYQQDRGKHEYKADHRSDHHNVVYHKTHGHRDSCRINDKHGHKKGRHTYRPQAYGSHYTHIQPHYRDGHHHDRTRSFPGSYFGSLAVLFYD
jgi:hypothetical protein